MVLLWLLGCSGIQKRDQMKSSESSEGEKNESEITIKSDRSYLDDLRKEVPEDVRSENDELATILNLMSGTKNPPSEINNRFQHILRRSRKKFEDQQRRDRSQFDRSERKKRDEFLATKKKEQEKFLNEKRSKEERAEFFRNHDEEKRLFFSDLQDRRREFESETRIKRNDQESYFRERTSTFNQELKDYSKRYYESENALRLKKQMEQKAQRMKRSDPSATPQPSGLEDFNQIPNTPGIPLGPSSGNEKDQ